MYFISNIGLGINTGLNDKDYENMIYFNFNKFQINLNDDYDKNMFKSLSKELISDDEIKLSEIPDNALRDSKKESESKYL